MKKHTNKLSFLGLSLFLLTLFACEKDEEQVFVEYGDAPTLSASSDVMELTEENSEDVAITFSWTEMAANWSNQENAHDGAINYILEIDSAGANFESPTIVEMGTSREKSYTVEEFNNLVKKEGLIAGMEGKVEARINVSNNVEEKFSNVVTITVVPFAPAVGVDYPNTIYMVGEATQNDWDNTQAMPMFLSESAENTYVYTGFLEGANFKFLDVLGEWTPMWGSDEAGGVVYRPTGDDPDPAVFEVPADGYYEVIIDTENLTFSAEPYDASGAETYQTIGIIGAFNEWGESVAMEQSSFNPHIWELEHTFEEATEMKFRANDAWDVNWGAESDPERLYGLGVQNGANLVIPAGTHTIRFNDLTGRYIFLGQ